MGDSDMNMGSGTDLDVSSDVESLDVLDDIDDTSVDEMSSDIDDLSMNFNSLDLDYADDTLDEIDPQDGINEASDASDDLLSDLEEVPDIDNSASTTNFDNSFSEDGIEMLEIDDDMGEIVEAPLETGNSLEVLDGVEDNSSEHINIPDTKDELDSLDFHEMGSSEPDSFGGMDAIPNESNELEEHTEMVGENDPDIPYPGQELTDVPPENLGDLPDVPEELSTSNDIVEETDLSEGEIEVFAGNAETELDVQNELGLLSLEDLSDSASETSDNGLDELILPDEEETGETSEEALEEIQAERDRLTSIRDKLEEMQSPETDEADEGADEGSPMVRTREITSEILESRERDTEEVLDDYRDNLREYGVEEEQIEEFIAQEREKIDAEYESLDRGDEYPQMYETPNDWESVAASLMGQEIPDELSNELSQVSDIQDQPSEGLETENQELEINYDEIYEGIQQDALEQGFENIQVDSDTERLDQSLESFSDSIWEGLTLDEQKDSMASLADYVVDVIGFEHPPTIEYYNNPQEGDFGGYNATTNTLQINEYMLYNSSEAADTIAHELWHAHQHECAINPQSARDYQYQYNFENYIPPALGQEAYESQLVEAEARAFAAQFKDRLSQLSGRSR